MKKFLLVLTFFAVVAYAGDVKVTISVNMKAQIVKGLFSVATDSVCVRGDFQAKAGDPGGNWQGNFFQMRKNTSDSIYKIDVTMPANQIDSTFQFKFVKNTDGWEGGDNKTFKLSAGPTQVLYTYWFNGDSNLVVKPLVTNTFVFTADMRTLYGTGICVFDPNQDSLLVMGMDWDGLGTLISGDRKCVRQITPSLRWKTSLVVKGPLGDSTKWKFRAYPETRYNNTGWELGGDHWVHYVADGSTVTIPEFVPAISPVCGVLSDTVPIVFQVDMNNAPKNRYNSQLIPVSNIAFMGVKGSPDPLGKWAGTWTAADTGTTPPTIIVLNDKGLNGDVTANDKIYSKEIKFAKGLPQGNAEFKFACMYPGADTANGGSSPLDNEGGFGENHIFMVKDAAKIVLKNIWGNFLVGIYKERTPAPEEYSLGYNFPNPFNPSTQFSYSIPKNGNVSLKVFNTLGQEVVTLVQGQQEKGKYTVTFDGNKLASGIYFYTLHVDNFTATRKMLLMK